VDTQEFPATQEVEFQVIVVGQESLGSVATVEFLVIVDQEYQVTQAT
jgi:hypothetical protein